MAALVVVAGSAGVAGGAWAGDGSPPPASGAVGGPDADNRDLLGGGANEDLFVPITPCRIIDTREAGGKLSAVTGSRVFDVAGSGPTFAGQGGKAGGCGIGEGATAIEATITAIDSGSGFLRAWPANVSQPNATFLNYGPSINITNTGTLAINGCTGFCLIDRDLRLRAFANDTHVVVEVNGYYTRQMGALIDFNGSVVNGNRVVSSTKIGQGQYAVVFDRNIATCSIQASTTLNGGDFVEAGPLPGTPSGAFVRASDKSSTFEDVYFYVEVTC